MPRHLQELDKEMCLTCHRHKTPELLLEVHESAAETCQHTPHNTSGHSWAQGQKLQNHCETGQLSSAVVWYLLRCSGCSCTNRSPAVTWRTMPWLQWKTFFSLQPFLSALSAERKPKRLPAQNCHLLQVKTLWVGTLNFNVTASQGGSSPILTGGKKRKAFLLAPARSHVW